MNTNVPSGRDGVHVYVLNETESGPDSERLGPDRRYLIVRERPSSAESWSEVVEPNSQENNHEK